MATRRTSVFGGAVAVVAVLVFALLAAFPYAAHAGQVASSYESGTYSIDGVVWQAAADRESMANSAFTRPMQLIVKDGAATLEAEIVPTNGQYLGELGYYPDYAQAAAPKDAQAKPVTVKSAYDNGYPHEVSFPLDTSLDMQWLKVYIPFMEELAAGSGTQYVRLVLDYDSIERTGDAPADAGGSNDSASDGKSGEGASADPSTDTPVSNPVASDALYRQLAGTIATADSYLVQTGVYTADSLSQLRSKRTAAQKVYDARTADALTVIMQIGDLRWGVQLLVPVVADQLDFSDLPDGTYTVAGSMVKVDKTTLSMADGALDHAVTVEVSDGAYRLVVDLGSVAMNGKTGYLGALRYYKSGYTTNAAGGLEGSTAKTSVLSYHTTSAGARVADEYGTDYPSSVSIPVIPEAKKDGYVPLDMFVPVMESIAKGTGTQAAYLKLETDKVYAGEQDVVPSSTETVTPAEADSGSAAAASETSLNASTLSGSGTSASAGTGLSASTSQASSALDSTNATAAQFDNATVADADAVGEASTITSISPVSKDAPLKGSVPGLVIALVALAIIVLGGVAFRKRNGLFK